jgi:cytochrome c556
MRKLKYALAFLAMTGALAPVTSQATQENRLKKLMVDKLRNAQRLLDGIVLWDFRKITASAEELIQISKTAEWHALRTPRFEMHSNEFRRAAEVVLRKAKDKNQDGVALSYVEMTLSCVRCHEHVREVRDARLPMLRPDLASVFPRSQATAPPAGGWTND